MPSRKLLAFVVVAALAAVIPAQPAFALSWQVNTTADGADADPAGDDVCETAASNGVCTLQAALDEANQQAGTADTITFAPGLGPITPAGASGWLVNGPVTVDGNGSSGAGATVIEGNDTVLSLFAVTSLSSPSTFRDMAVQNGVAPAGGGGGAFNINATTELRNVVADSNEGTATVTGISGAAVDNLGSSTLTIADSRITGNTIETTSGTFGFGAGIYTDGPLVLTDSVVEGNSVTGAGSDHRGGGIMASGPFQIERSTIAGNTVSGASVANEGAGLFNGTLSGGRTIVNTTIGNNSATGTAPGAGGVQVGGGTTITNATFNDNGGVVPGADLTAYGASTTATASNSIFASPGSCATAGGATIAGDTLGHNMDAGTTCGFGTSDGNMESTAPMFSGSLNLFGGGQKIYIPLWNSPTIDNADPTCGGALATDQRGRERPQGPTCDIGAYERDYRTLSASRTGTGSGSVTGTGISCGGDCEEMFVDGTQGLVLTATPSSGSQFASWIGCDSVAGSQCTVDLGNDRAVTAAFSLIPAPPPTTNPPPTTTTKKKKKCKKKKSKGRSAGAAKKKKCRKKKK